MIACDSCHSAIHDASRFCPVCGRAQPQTLVGQVSGVPATYSVPAAAQDSLASHHGGFVQHFGLDPRVALMTVIVDAMLFGGQVLTLGSTVALSIPAGIVMGLITYKAQRHWYGDDRDSALIKGLIVGLLTAIPTSLPGFLTIPSGLLGLMHFLPGRRKSMRMLGSSR